MIGERSVAERARDLLARIERVDREINAYVYIDGDRVVRDAEALDALAPHARGPLHGMTLAVKDIVDVAGMPTRAGSAFFTRLPDADAPVVRALRNAGALIVGKTNTHEFAWGITTENPHFGRTKNPWDLARIPGGSSGGSGAALAADLAEAAIGTDTLGSVRIPSACCGTSGLRPVTGELSTDGVFPLTPGLDTPGPMAHDVATVAKLYAVMRGVQPARTPPAGTVRLARLRGGRWDAVAPDMTRALDAAITTFRNGGIAVDEVTWWDGELYDAIVIIQQESAANVHRAFLADPANRYGDDVRERVTRAVQATNLDLAGARARIARSRLAFDAAASGVDALIAPVIPDEAPVSPAPAQFRSDVIPLITPASAFALAALALPIGFGTHGIPLGMQLLATRGDTAALFALGEYFQRETSWHEQRPAP